MDGRPLRAIFTIERRRVTSTLPPRIIPEQFETERLLLRPYCQADVEEVAAAIEESRVALEKWTPDIARHRTPEEVARGLGGLERAWSERRKLVFGIFDRSTSPQKFVGEVGLYTLEWATATASIGVWLRQSACGRDFGREGFSALAARALGQLELRTLEARVHPENFRSRRLVEKSGFKLWASSPGVSAYEGTDEAMLVYRRTGQERRAQA
jgi:RimJ/RimL family protein N-acetyltransferase